MTQLRQTGAARASEAVTIVAHDVGPVGGMERQLTELIRGLLAAGYTVTVIARSCVVPVHPRLRWLRVPGPARPFPLAYPWFFVVGSWQVWRHRRGIVHTTGAIVVNRADVSTVHLCHHALRETLAQPRALRNSLAYRVSGWLSLRMSLAAERRVYRPGRTGALVAVSAGVARELERQFPQLASTIRVIPNGVDGRRYRPDEAARTDVRADLGLADHDFSALFVGGDWDRKGLIFAIGAVTATPGSQLIVVGAGDVPRYRELAQRMGAGGRVHFVGMRADAERYFAAADAFLLPTAYETFSLVTYEAAAAGLPLLVTRVSGVEDLLVDGRSGWFIERNVTAIAERLAALAASVELRRAMGREARAAAAAFTWEAVVEGYQSLYRHIAEGAAPRVQPSVCLSPPLPGGAGERQS